MQEANASYRPGVCNIGKNEIRKRYALGALGFAITAIFASLAILAAWPRWALLICFIPLFLGSEGIYQGYFKFCAGFASRGIFDFSGTSGEKGRVADKEAHSLDMKKAMSINLYSLATAIALTILIYAIK